MNHKVKCHSLYFERVVESNVRQRKTVEVRKNDRDYKEGDTMTLIDWNPEFQEGTGKWAYVLITHIVGSPWLDGDMVALSILLQDFGDQNRDPSYLHQDIEPTEPHNEVEAEGGI
jgi:hypothetical protein